MDIFLVASDTNLILLLNAIKQVLFSSLLPSTSKKCTGSQG